MAYPLDDPRRGVPASPNLPEVERRVLDFWTKDDTFAASIEARPAGDHGANEYVFYDGPPFANGLPHYGHLLTGYVKDVVPRYQTMRGHRVERRFGWDYPRPARRDRGRERTGRLRPAPTSRTTASTRFNDALPHVGPAVHGRVGALRHPHGPLGRLRERLQDHGPHYMESVIWAFKQLWDKGLVYEALPGHALLVGRRDPAVQLRDPPRRRHPAPPGPGRSPWPSTAPTTADPRADRASWSGRPRPWTLPSNLAARRRPRHRLRRRSKTETASTTSSPRPPFAKYEAQLGGSESLGTLTGADLAGARYEPALPLLRRPAERASGSSSATSSTPRRAPASSTSPRASARTTSWPATPPASSWSSPSTTPAASPPRCPTGTARTSSTPTRDIIKDLKETGASSCATTPTTTTTRTAGAPTRRSSTRPSTRGSSRSPAFRDRMVELNQQINWIPEHVRDGQFGRWLDGARDWSISRNRFWGSPIPVWRQRRPGVPAHRRLRLPRRDRSRLRRAPSTDLHRPDIDDLVRPNPDDPTGKSMMRRVPEVLDCWFDSGSMPYAPGPLPVREPGVVRGPLPRPTSSSSTSPRPAAGSTRCTSWPRRCSTGPPFENVICHGIAARRGRPQDLQAAAQLPRRPDPSSPTGPTPCAGTSCPRRSCGAATSPVTENGFRDAVRQIVLPLWNVWHFFTLYANAAGYEATPDRRGGPRWRASTASTSTCWPRPTTSSRRSPSDGRLRPGRRVRRDPLLPTSSTTGTSAAPGTGSGKATRPDSPRSQRH